MTYINLSCLDYNILLDVDPLTQRPICLCITSDVR